MKRRLLRNRVAKGIAPLGASSRPRAHALARSDGVLATDIHTHYMQPRDGGAGRPRAAAGTALVPARPRGVCHDAATRVHSRFSPGAGRPGEIIRPRASFSLYLLRVVVLER